MNNKKFQTRQVVGILAFQALSRIQIMSCSRHFELRDLGPPVQILDAELRFLLEQDKDFTKDVAKIEADFLPKHQGDTDDDVWVYKRRLRELAVISASLLREEYIVQAPFAVDNVPLTLPEP